MRVQLQQVCDMLAKALCTVSSHSMSHSHSYYSVDMGLCELSNKGNNKGVNKKWEGRKLADFQWNK